jgi:hypothetical protein
MKPRIKIITLGVGDLEKALSFYRHGMGLPTQGIVARSSRTALLSSST